MFSSVFQDKMLLFVNKNHTSHMILKVLKMITQDMLTIFRQVSVKFGPVASISEANLTTSSGKHLEKDDSLHANSIMRNFSAFNQQTCEFLDGFEESENTRREELANNRTERGTSL